MQFAVVQFSCFAVQRSCNIPAVHFDKVAMFHLYLSAIEVEALQLFSCSFAVLQTFVLQLWLQFGSFVAAVLQLCGLAGLQIAVCIFTVLQVCSSALLQSGSCTV